jgi:hypothetical protein
LRYHHALDSKQAAAIVIEKTLRSPVITTALLAAFSPSEMFGTQRLKPPPKQMSGISTTPHFRKIPIPRLPFAPRTH